jgi:hypothetical protein
MLRSGDGERSGEHAQPVEDSLLLGIEQLV